MTHFIDKDVLVAEIDKGINGRNDWQLDDYRKGYYDALIMLKKYLDTLEVKEVDLNKELSLEDYNSFFKKYPDLSDDWGFDEAWIFAKHFFELGLKAQKGEEV